MPKIENIKVKISDDFNIKVQIDGVKGDKGDPGTGGSGGGSSYFKDLFDVNLTTPSNNQLTKFNSTTEKWENFTPDYSPSNHNHNDIYYTETEINTILLDYASSIHNHDDRYYTETEIDTLLIDKSNTGHNHNDLYYTESQIDTTLLNYALSNHTHSLIDLDDTFINTPLINQVLKFDGSLWVNANESGGSGGSSTGIQDIFTATASQTVFTLSNILNGISIITVNGIQQKIITDYTISGTTLTFTYGLDLNDTVIVTYSIDLSTIEIADVNGLQTSLDSKALDGNNNDITSLNGITGGISTADYIDFDTTSITSSQVGRLKWNDTDGTLEFVMKGGNVTQQLGQECVQMVKNVSGLNITNGQVVSISGASGNRLTVSLARADTEINSSKTFAIATEDINNNNNGFVTTFGLVRDIDTSSFTEGSALYLSSTVFGGITTIEQSAPNHNVFIGWCIRSHAINGSIFVNIVNGFELSEIHDVLLSSVSNNQVLSYDSVSSLWKNKTIEIADINLLQTTLDGKQDDLVSGTNIKTINSTSLLGSGDIVISGGGIPANQDITINKMIIGNGANTYNNNGYYNMRWGNSNFSANYYGTNLLAIGYNALSTNGNGNGNVAIGNYSQNGIGNSTGQNTSVGVYSLRDNYGYGNTAIGYNSLVVNSSGNNNTALGSYTLNGSSTYSNCTGVGESADVTGSNQIQLGNSSTTTYVYGTVQNRSDLRDKIDIVDTTKGLDFILSLRPVDYKWNLREDYIVNEYIDKNYNIIDDFGNEIEINKVIIETSYYCNDGSKSRKRNHHGFIAQDFIDKEFGGFQDHSKNGGKDVMSLGYDEFIAPLVKSIQEQQEIINKLKQDIELLRLK